MNNIQLKQGTILQGGKYKIEKCLGQGSFGITYLAKMKSIISGNKGQTTMWVDVAVKEFFMKDFNSRLPDGSLNETTGGTIVEKYKKDFKREADNLSKMNHSGIVDILDTFEENNTCYLVMTYINGESLDAYISRNGAMKEKEALACFEQIADALHYMHCQHMLHLDLKPKNIMLDVERYSFVIDFGLSKQYDENDEPESSTTLGQGTQGYAPLEQGAPHSGHDFPVTIDVYALGATLYKMLTTQTPPHAADVLSSPEILKKTLAEKGVSKNTTSYILKAMSPRKEDRYSSVAGLMKAFGWKVKDYPQEVILVDVVEYPSKDNTIVEIEEKEREKEKTIISRRNKLIIICTAVICCLCILLPVLINEGIIVINRHGDSSYNVELQRNDSIAKDIASYFPLNSKSFKFTNCSYKKDSLCFLFECTLSREYSSNDIRMLQKDVNGCFEEIGMALEQTKDLDLIKKFCLSEFEFVKLNILTQNEIHNDNSGQNKFSNSTNLVSVIIPHSYFEEVADKIKDIQIPPVQEKVPVVIEENKPDNPSIVIVSDDDLYKEAIRKSDWNTIKVLADKGYIKAYVPLAKHYLKSPSTHSLAYQYAQKAKKQGIAGADEIIKELELYDF